MQVDSDERAWRSSAEEEQSDLIESVTATCYGEGRGKPVKSLNAAGLSSSTDASRLMEVLHFWQYMVTEMADVKVPRAYKACLKSTASC
jgi:hypothetical protein